MSKDSTSKTIVVATFLCIACSILVSTAAIRLRPMQAENKSLDIKKNLLLAAKLLSSKKASKEEITSAFGSVEMKLIDLSSGEVAEGVDESYDYEKAEKDPKLALSIPSAQDIARIKRRAKVRPVYLVKKNGAVDQIVIPFHGKGLWSTMYGFLCLDSDTRTVRGISYYQHGETPGLGGEIDNDRWKASWVGKVVLSKDDYRPIFDVVKGSVNMSSPDASRQVDGLSGATLTSNGVEDMVNYWVSEQGYGKYLENFRASSNNEGV
jgi:Na+-transporting NADH:ubiquinone oxidoreductase subunit C